MGGGHLGAGEGGLLAGGGGGRQRLAGRPVAAAERRDWLVRPCRRLAGAHQVGREGEGGAARINKTAKTTCPGRPTPPSP
eukprot:1188668-Prorocentrum_minimum.AAC.1